MPTLTNGEAPSYGYLVMLALSKIPLFDSQDIERLFALWGSGNTILYLILSFPCFFLTVVILTIYIYMLLLTWIFSLFNLQCLLVRKWLKGREEMQLRKGQPRTRPRRLSRRRGIKIGEHLSRFWNLRLPSPWRWQGKIGRGFWMLRSSWSRERDLVASLKRILPNGLCFL